MKTENGANFGDVKEFRVQVNGKDISDAVISAHVFQDIHSPTTTAIVNLQDTNNLLMNIPIRAGATLVITVETDLDSIGDGEKVWNFVIYKVGEKELINAGQQNYSLFAADKAFLLNQTKRVYRGFSNKKTTDIAKTIASESFGLEMDVHPTDGNISVVVPGWTPFYTLSWLLKSSLKDGAADYVQFQQHDGRLAMKSFEQLYSSTAESSGITFNMIPTGLRDDNGDTSHDYATTISKYQFEHFDALSNLSTGFYQSKLVSYDIINKSWTEKVFKFGDDNDDDKEMQDFDEDMFSSPDANVTFLPKHPGMTKGSGSYLDAADTWNGSRKSSIQKFEQEKLIIQVTGSAKACEWFAKNCDVDLPAQDIESGEQFDKKRRGKYLITSMAHMINKDAYMINAELTKKRLEE